MERMRLLIEEQKLELRRSVRSLPFQQRFHHAHFRSGRHRSVRSRPAVRILRRVLPRERNSVRQVSGAGPVPSGESPGAVLDGDRGHQDRRRFATRSAACIARFRRRCGRSCGPSCRCGKCPITSVTNGVHLPTWLNGDLAQLYDQYLQPDWRERYPDPKIWDLVEDIPEPGTVGGASPAQAQPGDLRARARGRGRGGAQGFGRRAAPLAEVLDPDTFTIGFARRFATYKRATLLFRDVERLKRLLTNRERPVQIVIAGKAHPKDLPGKTLIREIVQLSRDPGDRQAHRFRRGLQHRSGARDGAGRRPVAEHAAPRRGSLRHQRHEGRHQRRAEPEHSGRLVRRSLSRFQAAGPSATASRTPTTRTKFTPAPSTPCSKTRLCRCTIRTARKASPWSGCGA